MSTPDPTRLNSPQSSEQQPEKQNEQKKTEQPEKMQAANAERAASGESVGVENKRGGARGTAAMDPKTRQEVARKGGLAVSRNRQHMAEIGRKGGQAVSKNREHMANIGRKGGEASRGHR